MIRRSKAVKGRVAVELEDEAEAVLQVTTGPTRLPYLLVLVKRIDKIQISGAPAKGAIFLRTSKSRYSRTFPKNVDFVFLTSTIKVPLIFYYPIRRQGTPFSAIGYRLYNTPRQNQRLGGAPLNG
jgi:hypothetical protein